MLDLVRNHKRLMLLILLLLVLPSFVFFGIGSYERTQDGSGRVAEVDGEPISQTEWDNAHRDQIDRIRASNPNVDAQLLNSAPMKMATLDQLIQDRVLTATALKSHLVVTDQELTRTLMQIPQIAALRKPDGSFDTAAYAQLLAAQGLTPERFEAGVRQNLMSQRVIQSVAGTGFITQAATDQAMQVFGQQRAVQLAQFAPQEFRSKVTLSDADVQKYYQAHLSAFAEPESVDIEYAVLDASKIAEKVTVSEADVRAYYDKNQAHYGTSEERRASHILVAADASASAADKAKARAKAEQLLAEVRKDPAAFAEIARKNSDDPGSAAQGGDLGYFERGAMTKTFEDAVFSLKQGEISGLVESPFGFHIIQLTGIKPGSVRPFADVRSEIETLLRQQRVQQQFSDTARAFAAMTEEQSDSLEPAARKFGLTVQKAQGVTHAPAQGAQGALANQQFLDALFAGDARTSHRNIEPVQISPTLVAAARVTRYAPAHTRPFDAAKGLALELATSARAAELAVDAGKAKLADWQKDAAAAQVGPEITLSRLQQQSPVPPALMDAVMRVDSKKLPQLVGVDLAGQGYAVAKVVRVEPPPAADEATRDQARAQLAQVWGTAEGMAYMAYLKRIHKAKVLTKEPSTQGD